MATLGHCGTTGPANQRFSTLEIYRVLMRGKTNCFDKQAYQRFVEPGGAICRQQFLSFSAPTQARSTLQIQSVVVSTCPVTCLVTCPVANINYEALGMASREHMLQFVEPATIPTTTLNNTTASTTVSNQATPTIPRPLTTLEKSFLAHLSKKTWIAHSQPTPHGYEESKVA